MHPLSLPAYAPARGRHPRRILATVATLLVALTTLITVAPSAHAATRAMKVRHARSVALNQLGDWYAYGAAGPNRFDCSGLLYYSTHRAGLTGMPRTAGAQAAFTHRIRKSDMRSGDYMFFYGSGGVYHSAIFLAWRNGRAWMVDAPRPGERVHRHYAWTSRWFGGTLRH